jgi:transposase
MPDQFWLTKAQLERIEPFFPRTRGIPRVDDRRVVSGIVHVIRNGLRWRDAPAVYGSHKTLYNRFVRWSRGDQRQEKGDTRRKHSAELFRRTSRCAVGCAIYAT